MRDAPRLRAFLVACQLATYAATWPLWDERVSPPPLPLVAIPVPFGILLAVAAALSLVRPVAGVCAHVVIATLACAADLTRLQPTLISFPILVASTMPSRDALALARVHLATLWIAGGIHKLVSPDFATSVAPWMGAALPRAVAPWTGALAIGLELATGILAAVPRAPRLAIPLAIALHAGILAVLVAHRENEGVWAWNAAIAMCAARILGSPVDVPAIGPPWRAMAAILVALPFAMPLGAPAGLAGALYASADPRTLWCDRDGLCSSDRELRETLAAFGVPIPTTPAIHRAYFDRSCAAGDTWQLRVDDVVLDVARCSGQRISQR